MGQIKSRAKSFFIYESRRIDGSHLVHHVTITKCDRRMSGWLLIK